MTHNHWLSFALARLKLICVIGYCVLSIVVEATFSTSLSFYWNQIGKSVVFIQTLCSFAQILSSKYMSYLFSCTLNHRQQCN